jgi:hypothetical protein
LTFGPFFWKDALILANYLFIIFVNNLNMKNNMEIDNFHPILFELFYNLKNGNPDSRYEILDSGKALRIIIDKVFSNFKPNSNSTMQGRQIRKHISQRLFKLGWQEKNSDRFSWEYDIMEYKMFGECPICTNKFDRWEFLYCFCRVCGQRLEPKEKSSRDYIKNYKYSLILS